MNFLQQLNEENEKIKKLQESKFDIFKIQKKNGKCFFTALYDVKLTDSEARTAIVLSPGDVYWNTSNLHAIYALHGTMTREEAVEKLKKAVEQSTKKRMAQLQNELIRLQKNLDDLEKIH